MLFVSIESHVPHRMVAKAFWTPHVFLIYCIKNHSENSAVPFLLVHCSVKVREEVTALGTRPGARAVGIFIDNHKQKKTKYHIISAYSMIFSI